MKPLIFAIALAMFCASSAFGNASQDLPSQSVPAATQFETQIERVVIFPNSARITRTVVIPAGTFSSFDQETLGGEIYKLTNTSATARKIRVFSQIEVSEIDDIKIEILTTEKNGVPATTPDYTFDAQTGFIHWQIELPPQSQTKIILSTQKFQKNKVSKTFIFTAFN